VHSEIDKFSKGSYNGLNPDPIFIDLYNDPPVTLYARAMPPSRQFPKVKSDKFIIYDFCITSEY